MASLALPRGQHLDIYHEQWTPAMKLAIQGPLDSCTRLNRVSQAYHKAPQQMPPVVEAEGLTFEVSHARYRHPHTGRRLSDSLYMPVELHHTKHFTRSVNFVAASLKAAGSQRYVP
jgi:hypothetical protein